MTTLYRRRTGLTERLAGDLVFLADPVHGTVYRLNETGSALWRLLAEPLAAEEAVAVFREAYPDHPAEEVGADVRGLLDALVEDELVEAVEKAERV